MTATERKPNVFLGCSREAIDYARAAVSHLERVAQVNPWYAGTFGSNDYTMEALERELDTNDFGVFVFAAEDLALIREKPVFITRDNTLFEMGLFWGRLRRGRVFCLVPRDLPEASPFIPGKPAAEFHLPSDLDGLTLLRYGSRSDGRYSAAMDVPCGEIAAVIRREKAFSDPAYLLREKAELLERKQSILRFFWSYIKNVSEPDPTERYSAYAEAIRNSILPPPGFRTTGAAIWRASDGSIRQVGGNVGRGRSFPLDGAGEGTSEQIYVLEALNSKVWSFFNRREIEEVYILCYPLGKEHVLSVHISGDETLHDDRLEEIVAANDELLNTIRNLIGGDSR
ncbi:TIR domain-containing protein [Gorillibacterium timonense]|uniref:TIR domain-containing protein n=1 Tax=Gorillibacterium timonense TaxID=1689269 RepID=UPI00071DBF29|nr:TIR domain-containing protein [Gorillibacterium timonense]